MSRTEKPLIRIARGLWSVGRTTCKAYVFALLFAPLLCHAQQRDASVSPATSQASVAPANSALQRVESSPVFGLGQGPVSPGDSVEVDIYDAPEMSFRTLVSSGGDISVPLLGVFHIAGLTTVEAAQDLASRLRSANLLVHPQVLILVQQFGKGITVLGQVRSPGIYRVGSGRTVAELLALAGGATDRSGHLLRVYTPGDVADEKLLRWDPSLRRTFDVDTPIRDGQVLDVSTCGIIYVGGNVGKPGAYSICESLKTSVSEAVALAGGMNPSTKDDHTILLHETADGKRSITTIHLKDILNGRAPDPTLEADDILYVPPSALKAGAKIAAQAAIGFASQALVYSVQR